MDKIILYIYLGFIATGFIYFISTIPYSIKNIKLYSKINKKIESEGYYFNSSLLKRLSRIITILIPITNVDEYKKGMKLLNDEEAFDNYIDNLLTYRHIFETEEKRREKYRDRMQEEIDKFQKDPYSEFKKSGITKEEIFGYALTGILSFNNSPNTYENKKYLNQWNKIMDDCLKDEVPPKKIVSTTSTKPKYKARIKQIEKAKKLM